VYPLDLDTTFGCQYNPDVGNNHCWDVADDIWWLNGVAPLEGPIGWPEPAWMNMLIHLTLNEPQCRAAFEGRLCSCLRSPWWSEELPGMIAATAATIRPAVAQDPNDMITDEALTNFDATIADMLEFLEDRRTWLEASIPCP